MLSSRVIDSCLHLLGRCCIFLRNAANHWLFNSLWQPRRPHSLTSTLREPQMFNLTNTMEQSSYWKANSSLLVKKFPTFYGTGRFLNQFTGEHQWSPTWVISVQSMPSQSISWRYLSILSSHLLLHLPSKPQISHSVDVPELFTPRSRYVQ